MGGMGMRQCTALFYINLIWEKKPSTEKTVPTRLAGGKDSGTFVLTDGWCGKGPGFMVLGDVRKQANRAVRRKPVKAVLLHGLCFGSYHQAPAFSS